MRLFRLPQDKKREDVDNGYLVRPKISIAANDPDQPINLTCDTCTKNVCDNEAIESRVLPYSQFCCIECRNEAELAAENANPRTVVRSLLY